MNLDTNTSTITGGLTRDKVCILEMNDEINKTD